MLNITDNSKKSRHLNTVVKVKRKFSQMTGNRYGILGDIPDIIVECVKKICKQKNSRDGTIRELIIRSQKGDEKAKEEVFFYYFYLVTNAANYFANFGYEYKDLIQAGCEALLKTINDFSNRNTYTLPARANREIMLGILRHILDCDNAQYLNLQNITKTAINRAEKELFLKNGYKPKRTEVFKSLGVRFIELLSVEEVDNDSELVIEDVHDMAEMSDLKDRLEDMLRALPKRAEVILTMIYFEEETLEVAGQEIGIGREGTRQLRDKSLRKLRHPSRSKHVASYYFE